MYVLLNHVIVINSADSTISRALQYINENITNNISLEDVAAYACVTKYHLCRMFRKKTNLTIMEYILERRISIAKEKLIYERIPIETVAYESGFTNASYFSRIFRQKEGVTPLTYRNMYQE